MQHYGPLFNGTNGSGGSALAGENSIADGGAYKSDQPVIHTIGFSDLKDVLVKGLADFNAMLTHIIFMCLIYPLVILVSARIYAGYEVVWLVFPLLAGYTLIGPLVATGMYELSRRREQGLDTSRWKAFHVLQRHATRSIGVLGALLMVIYLAWLWAAWIIYEKHFGAALPTSIMDFAIQVFTTPAGWSLITFGTGVGLVFAIMVLTLSVVSFPMLIDRDVGLGTAIQTSIRAVIANPVTMAAWGLIAAYALLIGSLPFFVGLAVVLPVLGHATWHLYRKIVEF